MCNSFDTEQQISFKKIHCIFNYVYGDVWLFVDIYT